MPPGTSSGKTEARFGGGAAAAVGTGGAEAGGRRPRARSAAMRGLSGAEGAAGWGVTLVTGSWEMRLAAWGGGVGCWRAAVFLMSSASVPGLRSCWSGWEIACGAGVVMDGVDMVGRGAGTACGGGMAVLGARADTCSRTRRSWSWVSSWRCKMPWRSRRALRRCCMVGSRGLFANSLRAFAMSASRSRFRADRSTSCDCGSWGVGVARGSDCVCQLSCSIAMRLGSLPIGLPCWVRVFDMAEAALEWPVDGAPWSGAVSGCWTSLEESQFALVRGCHVGSWPAAVGGRRSSP